MQTPQVTATPVVTPISAQVAPAPVKKIPIGNIILNKGTPNECTRGVFITLKDQHGRSMDFPQRWTGLSDERRAECTKIFQDLITKAEKDNPGINLESASVDATGFTPQNGRKILHTSYGDNDGTRIIWREFRDTLLTGRTDEYLTANLTNGLTRSNSLQYSFTPTSTTSLGRTPSPQSIPAPIRHPLSRRIRPAPLSISTFTPQSPTPTVDDLLREANLDVAPNSSIDSIDQ